MSDAAVSGTVTGTGASEGLGTLSITYTATNTVRPGNDGFACVWLASGSSRTKEYLAKNPAVMSNVTTKYEIWV